MFLLYSTGVSPLQARQSISIIKFVVIILLIAILVFLLWFFAKWLRAYKKSDKFIEKEMQRLTNQKDIKIFTNKYNLSSDKSTLLFTMCKNLKIPNFNYIFTDNQKMLDYCKKYYFYLKEHNAKAQLINDFFSLNFTLEKLSASTKNLLSTRQLKIESVVFYLTKESEQYPLYVKENVQDYFALEIPDFMATNERIKPPLLERLCFITKAQNGMTYHFTARAIRYRTMQDGKTQIVISHTEDLVNQAHRNSKREPIDGECIFTPAKKIISEDKHKTVSYKVSQREYIGKLTNISAGGCCIKTKLPIKEGQHLSVVLKCLDLDEKIIGLIRKTRQLPDGFYNLHIQFLQISLESKNKIYAYAYKYEI